MEAQIGTNILLSEELLRKGKLVAIPTETVYGLAANALDINAVSDIFKTKNRPNFDPLIIHVANFEEINKYAEDISEDIWKLAEKFSPGPITFLLKKKDIIPDLVTSGLERVAIRIPDHKLTLKLLSKLDFPLAAPSANPFGYVSPTNAEHVYNQLGQKIPYILDGGQCEVGLESTIIGYADGELTVFRKGGLALETLENFLGKKIKINDHSSSNPAAPGMLLKHYSPNKRIQIWEPDKVLIDPNKKIGFLGFKNENPEISSENQYILSKKGNLAEAANRLFSGLRWFDQQDVDTVYIELVPEEGLGMAINDRLKRAAAKS
jgi:L-threonylcarbamoyladenylate synthase